MAIYRGPGGPGDATTDATSEGIVASNAAAAAQQILLTQQLLQVHTLLYQEIGLIKLHLP